jgi:Na+/H+-dicarboxylate symporter
LRTHASATTLCLADFTRFNTVVFPLFPTPGRQIGNLGKIGSRTFGLYMSTTAFAAVEGMVCVLFFAQFFSVQNLKAAAIHPEHLASSFAFVCPVVDPNG